MCKILDQEDVKPHKVRYYLERRDPDFAEKMAEVLCVYRQVGTLHARRTATATNNGATQARSSKHSAVNSATSASRLCSSLPPAGLNSHASKSSSPQIALAARNKCLACDRKSVERPRSTCSTENRRRQMKASDIATELDRVFAAATRNAVMSGVVISDMIDPLYAIHKALSAEHASGELTDEEYKKKARELLGMVGRLGVVVRSFSVALRDRSKRHDNRTRQRCSQRA